MAQEPISAKSIHETMVRTGAREGLLTEADAEKNIVRWTSLNRLYGTSGGGAVVKNDCRYVGKDAQDAYQHAEKLFRLGAKDVTVDRKKLFGEAAGKGDWAYAEGGRRIFVPDNKITKDKPEYNYRPLRGYSTSLAVEDINDKCIGFIDTKTLGYDNVKAWMAGTKYIVREAIQEAMPDSVRALFNGIRQAVLYGPAKRWNVYGAGVEDNSTSYTVKLPPRTKDDALDGKQEHVGYRFQFVPSGDLDVLFLKNKGTSWQKIGTIKAVDGGGPKDSKGAVDIMAKHLSSSAVRESVVTESSDRLEIALVDALDGAEDARDEARKDGLTSVSAICGQAADLLKKALDAVPSLDEKTQVSEVHAIAERMRGVVRRVVEGPTRVQIIAAAQAKLSEAAALLPLGHKIAQILDEASAKIQQGYVAQVKCETLGEPKLTEAGSGGPYAKLLKQSGGVSAGFTKKALIRDPNSEPGTPAKMSLNCVCGSKVDMGMSNGPLGGSCSRCGKKYDGRGYIVESSDDPTGGQKSLKLVKRVGSKWALVQNLLFPNETWWEVREKTPRGWQTVGKYDHESTAHNGLENWASVDDDALVKEATRRNLFQVMEAAIIPVDFKNKKRIEDPKAPAAQPGAKPPGAKPAPFGGGQKPPAAKPSAPPAKTPAAPAGGTPPAAKPAAPLTAKPPAAKPAAPAPMTVGTPAPAKGVAQGAMPQAGGAGNMTPAQIAQRLVGPVGQLGSKLTDQGNHEYFTATIAALKAISGGRNPDDVLKQMRGSSPRSQQGIEDAVAGVKAAMAKFGGHPAVPPSQPLAAKPPTPAPAAKPTQQMKAEARVYEATVEDRRKFLGESSVLKALDGGRGKLLEGNEQEPPGTRVVGKKVYLMTDGPDLWWFECPKGTSYDGPFKSKDAALARAHKDRWLVVDDKGRMVKAAGSLDEWGNRPRFANAGSALRAASKSNPRSLPCPTCKRPNMLTPADARQGYQCDICANAEEGTGF